jgi:hypothetical protein
MRLRETVQGEFKSDKIVTSNGVIGSSTSSSEYQPRELVLNVPSDLCL